jgi:outer membrane lipoprotein
MGKSSFVLILLSGLMAACASPIPHEIRTPLSDAPSLGEARTDTQAGIGRRVRWGGTIVEVENMEKDTWIQVVSRPLDRDGAPQATDSSEGRFFARIDGFLDPAIYAADRDITVTGVLEQGLSRKVGEYPYLLPVVHAPHYYLWPRKAAYRRPDYVHDWIPPFWSPWYGYPWYGYPWGYGSAYWW